MRKHPQLLVLPVIGIVFAAVLAACGGGGGGGGGASLPGGGSLGPQSYSTSVPFSTSSTTTATFSTISSGVSGSIVLPAASGTSTASLVFESSLGSGVPAPASFGRRTAQSIGGSNLTLLAAIAMTVSAPVTVTSSPGFSFTVPNAIAGDAYVAYYDANNSSAGWNVLVGPGTASGLTITFPSQSITPPITFVPNDTYIFALVVSSAPATGAALSYSGSKTTSFAYGYSFGYPTTPPTPIPTSIGAIATVAVSVGASPYPATAPTPGLADLHVAESDSASLNTTTFTTDSWIGVSGTSTYLTQTYATVQQEPSSATLPVITTIYGTPQTTDQYPQNGGASWSNSPRATINYSYADGDSGTRTIASDGSYSDTENLLVDGAGGSAVLTENSDGSGSIVGPYFGGGIIDSVMFSANSSSTCNSVPAGTSVNAPCLTATVNYSNFAVTTYGFLATETVPDATWYNLPLVLYSESDGITANASLPGSCSPNSYGTSANDVRRTIITTDTVLGVVETTVFDSYELNGQPICLLTSDTQNYSYDEQGNVPSFLLVGSPGLEIITTTENLILQPGASGVESVRQNVASTTPNVSRSMAGAIQAHQLSRFVHDRLIRTHAFMKALRTQRVTASHVTGGGAR